MAHADSINPYAPQYHEASQNLHTVKKSLHEAREEVNRYNSIDIVSCQRQLEIANSQLELQQKKINFLDEKIISLSNKIKIYEKKSSIGINPFTWFSAEKKFYRERYRVSKFILDELIKYKNSYISSNNEIKKQIKEIDCIIQEYNKININLYHEDIKKLEIKERDLCEIINRLHKPYCDFNNLVQPVINELNTVNSKIKSLDSNLYHVRTSLENLSNASNSYKRARIHQDLEYRYGEGNPNKLMLRFRKDKATLERTQKKLQERLDAICKRHSYKISTLIIDGNNLLYAHGDEYIGIVPLQTLVNILNEYKVIVVFDASITKFFNENTLKKMLGREIEMHIAPSDIKADEIILNMAEVSATTFVISNDKFTDFPEKKAVSQGRILKHYIANGVIQIPELEIRLSY